MHTFLVRLRIGLFLGLLVFSARESTAAVPSQRAAPIDVLVYGGTASGVITAYSAAREGLHVRLLEPGHHLGGMVTGGLSATDLGDFRIIGGYARDFYLATAGHYGIHSLDRASDWRSEPHIDEAVFGKMLADAGVEVFFHERIREHKGAVLRSRRILSITTTDQKQWPARIFIDCSYEGDLLAQTGVPFVVGRESAAEFDEDLAGVRAQTPAHQFTWPLSAYDAGHHLLPEIDPGPLAASGSADKKVQAYNFRLILTNNPANRVAWPRPNPYNPECFALLTRYLEEFPAHRGRQPTLHDITNPVMIPNEKADFNNNGPISTDYIGHSWLYPDATYAEKKLIWEDTLNYTQSFFYFLSQDPSVPSSLREEVNRWGLAGDEFADTGHWPDQLYIREARRMRGAYIMRQADLQSDRIKPDSIGMGSYNSDSHNVERVARADGTVTNEGDVQVPVKPYEIAYRTIVPNASQLTNLIVPVCFSATHIAYSSLRMEPQYMIMGQAAGAAAHLAIQHHTSVQNISIEEMQDDLHRHKAVLHLADVSEDDQNP
jgi:hypothetical protein